MYPVGRYVIAALILATGLGAAVQMMTQAGAEPLAYTALSGAALGPSKLDYLVLASYADGARLPSLSGDRPPAAWPADAAKNSDEDAGPAGAIR